MTEQTSHHPPVSAFYIDCPQKGITARGYDHLSAKFTGTSIRVTAGAHNLGIFITLDNRDEEQYQLTHPAAHLGGLLRGWYIAGELNGIKLTLDNRNPKHLSSRLLFCRLPQNPPKSHPRIPRRRLARPRPKQSHRLNFLLRSRKRHENQDQGGRRIGYCCPY